jgi:hypothetical protein
MNILYWILGILVGYVVLMFAVARFIFPFMGFGKYKAPSSIPQEIKNTIVGLEAQSSNQREYLELAYAYVQANWLAERMKTIVNLSLIFRTDLSQLWRERGYAHCNTINYILAALLVGSNYFTAEDIRMRHKFLNFVVHQYMQVKVDGNWLDVDPAPGYLMLPVGKKSPWLA